MPGFPSFTRFTDVNNHDVWVNPQHVALVRPSSGSKIVTMIVMAGTDSVPTVVVQAPLRDVVAVLTGHVPEKPDAPDAPDAPGEIDPLKREYGA